MFQDYESQLSGLKQHIVTYLGSLGGSVNHAMLAGSEEEISRRAIAWDTNQHLRFYMPFFDMKPIIYFGMYRDCGCVRHHYLPNGPEQILTVSM